MKALIDGDILCYSYGSLNDEQGRPLTWNLIVNHLNAKIREICDKVGADEYCIYITGDNNFRKTEATIKPYKGNRKDLEKPHSHDRVKKYLTSGKPHPFEICEDWEADDGMAMAQEYEYDNDLWYGATCICSNDKDLRMVPGYHYSWAVGSKIKEKPMTWISEEEGNKWFFTQLLTGDPTDNIPGLYRVGPKNAEKLLHGLTEPLSLYSKVYEQYECRFGSYWKLFMHENARLLYMLRSPDDDVRIWLDELEEKRIEALRNEEKF